MYQDPVISAYIELIKSKNGTIKTYYQGDPIRIPMSDLPCAIVSKRETRIGTTTNQQDEHGMALSISVITDIRADLSTVESSENVVAGIATLYDLMEGRSADYTLKNDSILGILRHNIAVDLTNGLRTDLGSITRVDYGTTLRGRAPEAWSIEARVDFIASIIQVR